MERRRYPPPSYNPVRPGQSRKGSYPHGGRGKARHPQRYGPSPVTVQQLPRATNSNPFGFNIAPPQPKSLPDDHPLKVELAKVREHREKRKKYWAGLAMTIPEEMRNEGSYDYQRWQAEDRLAEEAIENLVKMITAAELGFQVVERPVVLDSKDQARLARENKKRQQRAMEHERLYEPERRKSIGIGDLSVKNWVQGVGQQPLQEADSRLGTECVPSLQEDAVSITESEFDRIEATREAEREAAGRLEAERIRQTEAIRLSSAEQSDHVLGSKEQTPVATDQGVTGIEASVVPSSPAKATGYRSPDAGEQSSPDGGVKLIPKPVSEALQPVPSTTTQPTAISGVEAQKDAVMSEADDLDIERNQEDMLAALLLEIHGPPESGTVEEDTAETSAITPAFDKKMTLSPAPDMAPAVAKELPSAANKASPVPTFPSFPAGNKPSTISTAASTVPKGASPIPTFPSFPTGIRASPIPLPAFPTGNKPSTVSTAASTVPKGASPIPTFPSFPSGIRASQIPLPAFPTGNKPSTVSTSASTVPKFPSFPGVPTAPAPTTPLDASNSSVAFIFPTPIAKPTVHTAPTTSVSTTPITVPSIFKASVATTFPAPISTPTVKAAITAPAVPKTSISLPASSGLVLNERTVERNIAFQEISAAKLGNPNWKVPTAAIGVSASSGLTIPQVATPQPFQSQAIPAPPVAPKASAAPVHDVERRDAPSIPSTGTPGNPTPKLSVMALARARLIARQKEVAAKSAEAAPIIQSIEVEPPARAQPKSSNYRAGEKRPRTKSRKPGPDDDYMDLDIDKFNDPVEVVDMQDRSNSDSEGGPLINRARIPKHSRQIKDVRPTAPLATRTNSIKSVKMPNPSKPTPISKNHDRQQAKLPRAADAREPEDLTRRVLRTGNLVSEVTEEDIAGLFEGSQM
jgi:hypothetical protein